MIIGHHGVERGGENRSAFRAQVRTHHKRQGKASVEAYHHQVDITVYKPFLVLWHVLSTQLEPALSSDGMSTTEFGIVYDIALCSSNSCVASRCRSYVVSSPGAAKSFRFTKIRLSPRANRIWVNGMDEIAPQIEDLPSNRFDTASPPYRSLQAMSRKTRRKYI